MTSSESSELHTTVVVARGVDERVDWEVIDASSVDAAKRLVDALTSPGGPGVYEVCASLGPAADRDQLVAIVSMLVMSGVRAFETTDVQPVQRILDTHAALAAGRIEVLEA